MSRRTRWTRRDFVVATAGGAAALMLGCTERPRARDGAMGPREGGAIDGGAPGHRDGAADGVAPEQRADAGPPLDFRADARFKLSYPKLGALYIGGERAYDQETTDVNTSQTNRIDAYDLLVTNFDDAWRGAQGERPVDVARKIKALNPNIMLIQHMITVEHDRSVESPLFAQIRAALEEGVGPKSSWNWYLKTPDGADIPSPSERYPSSTKSIFLTNCYATSGDDYSGWVCKPLADGRSIYEVVIDAYWEHLMHVPGYEMDGYYDGMFQDRMGVVNWGAWPDFDGDGAADDNDSLSVSRAYRNGCRLCAKAVREKKSGWLALGNTGSWGNYERFGGPQWTAEYQAAFDGGFQEGAMGARVGYEGLVWSGDDDDDYTYDEDWANFSVLAQVVTALQDRMRGGPNFTIFDARGPKAQYWWLRYCITACLTLTDFHFAYSDWRREGKGMHHWFDEYDLGAFSRGEAGDTGWMGKAIDAPQRAPRASGAYLRAFENALAICVPRDDKTDPRNPIVEVEVALPAGNWALIDGVQDPAVNSGAAVGASVTIAKGDGRLLRRQ